MIRISCVSYLNSAPFIYGIRNHDFGGGVTLELDIPSECARKLIAGEVDLGLIPVAVIPDVPDAHIISRYCIGADGPVRSVTLLGDVPLSEMKTVLLDYQSRTSVALTRMLARRFWKIDPLWKKAAPGFEHEIGGEVGGVVIGDRSLRIRDHFKVVADLSEEWKKMTGLPFVFAVWVSNRKLDDSFIKAFESALENGLQSLDQVIGGLTDDEKKGVDVRQYLTRDVSYDLDEQKKEALRLFLSYLEESPD